MKLIGDRFKPNKMLIKLKKSLWLLAYTCSKSLWTNPWNNNPYRVIKHETPLLSQRVSKTQTARGKKKKGIIALFLTVFPMYPLLATRYWGR